MRVGPSTPITPLRLPRRYAEVTRVNSASCGSVFSVPMVSRSPLRWCSSNARRRRSRRSVRSRRWRIRVLEANSGCSASGWARPSTTPPPPALGGGGGGAHRGVGGDLGLLRERLGASQHHRALDVGEVEELVALGHEDVEQTAPLFEPRRLAEPPAQDH